MQETIKPMPTLPIGLAVRQEHLSKTEKNTKRNTPGIVIPIGKINSIVMTASVLYEISKEKSFSMN